MTVIKKIGITKELLAEVVSKECAAMRVSAVLCNGHENVNAPSVIVPMPYDRLVEAAAVAGCSIKTVQGGGITTHSFEFDGAKFYDMKVDIP